MHHLAPFQHKPKRNTLPTAEILSDKKARAWVSMKKTWLPGFFFFNILIINYFFQYETIETHAGAFLPINISAVGSVESLQSLFHSKNNLFLCK